VQAIKLAQQRHIGWVFVTDGTGLNRYDHLPLYWKQEVEIIASLNDPSQYNETTVETVISLGDDIENQTLPTALTHSDHPVIPVPPSVKAQQEAEGKAKSVAKAKAAAKTA
jgi:hypothetical protein